MKKQHYINKGIEYLNLETIKEQTEFFKEVEKMPIKKFRVFKKWIIDVNQHENHKNTKESKQFYIDRLSRWL